MILISKEVFKTTSLDIKSRKINSLVNLKKIFFDDLKPELIKKLCEDREFSATETACYGLKKATYP